MPLNAVQMILKYLKKSSGQRILYLRHGHLAMGAYINANWTGLKANRRLTIFFIFYFFFEWHIVPW